MFTVNTFLQNHNVIAFFQFYSISIGDCDRSHISAHIFTHTHKQNEKEQSERLLEADL